MNKFIKFIYIIKLNYKGKNTRLFAVLLFSEFRRACIGFTESRKTEREREGEEPERKEGRAYADASRLRKLPNL